MRETEDSKRMDEAIERLKKEREELEEKINLIKQKALKEEELKQLKKEVNDKQKEIRRHRYKPMTDLFQTVGDFGKNVTESLTGRGGN